MKTEVPISVLLTLVLNVDNVTPFRGVTGSSLSVLSPSICYPDMGGYCTGKFCREKNTKKSTYLHLNIDTKLKTF